MSLYAVDCDELPFLVLIVRASSINEAKQLGAQAAAQYLDHVPAVTAEYVDPGGPTGVLVEVFPDA